MECKDGVCYLKKPAAGASVEVFELGASACMLEFRAAGASVDGFELQMQSEGEGEWNNVGAKLLPTFIRKKNLVPGKEYKFRARAKISGGEMTPYSNVLAVKTLDSEPMSAPIVRSAFAQQDGKFTLQIDWGQQAGATRYHVEMRERDGGQWQTLSDQLKGTSVRKKNLPSSPGYVFRVRALFEDKWSPWSLVSAPKAVGVVEASFKRLLGETLLQRDAATGAVKQVSTDALAGKIVLLYASASWCPPCQQQSKMMKQTYPELVRKGLPVEVVFISADRSQAEFEGYFGSMPWLALPFGQKCQEIMNLYKVQGIPQLMVFSPAGNLISNNVAGTPLTEQLVQAWMQHA
jgi:thiol-disulfide isomerase/thioredoxin